MNHARSVVEAFEMARLETEPLLYLVRDKALQVAAVARLDTLTDRVDGERLSAIAEAREDRANYFLGLGCLTRAMRAELTVYIELKSDRPNEAWNALVDAQELVAMSGRAHAAFDQLRPKAGHLRDLEASLFPPQIFTSIGSTVKRQTCSICSADYEMCDHLAGQAYMGRFCTVRLGEMQLDHIAIVEDPADRRCRAMSFGVDAGQRDRMTWIVSPPADD